MEKFPKFPIVIGYIRLLVIFKLHYQTVVGHHIKNRRNRRRFAMRL